MGDFQSWIPYAVCFRGVLQVPNFPLIPMPSSISILSRMALPMTGSFESIFFYLCEIVPLTTPCHLLLLPPSPLISSQGGRFFLVVFIIHLGTREVWLYHKIAPKKGFLSNTMASKHRRDCWMNIASSSIIGLNLLLSLIHVNSYTRKCFHPLCWRVDK